MPLARYFIFVGGMLIALLLIADWCLPNPPAMFCDQQVAIDKAVIRIKSSHKWPEKIVLDTSQPTFAPSAVTDPPAARTPVLLPSDEALNRSNFEAMAQRPHTQEMATDSGPA